MKDYDTTLARIAGNIASGLANQETPYGEARTSEAAQDVVCNVAVRMAKRIVDYCKEQKPNER